MEEGNTLSWPIGTKDFHVIEFHGIQTLSLLDQGLGRAVPNPARLIVERRVVHSCL